ncbi:hypothetical protein [Pseudomonas fluorescens]|uniref:hypothetical protein n=1 Tax=Pseudomonas fluorescens TaxID=294 RepID=UPI0006421859|nr:hypothetical protein [Pseudomonas fluorescens]
MSKHAITEAVGITAEAVLQIGKLYSSNELRGIQKKLTATTGDLRKLANGWQRGSGLLGSLGDLLSREQSELLRNAAQLIDSIGHNVTHAKEKRVRAEKDAKRRQDARNTRAKQLIAAEFPLLHETVEQQLEVLKDALVFNRAGVNIGFYDPIEYNQKWIKHLDEAPKVGSWTTPLRYLKSCITSARSDLIQALCSDIAYDDGSDVEERLKALKQKIADRLFQTPLTAEEEKTLQLWKSALTLNAWGEV